MDPRTQERVEQWDSRPFNGGYDGLSDLADTGFSGAVCVTGTWLFMLNGRVVGVFEGDIEDAETGSGTVYQAPHPSLPLLCSMEERGGETRAKYYTNETPLEEVDDTLQDGSFTGYIELSENVLSGDYYAVYYGGRRMAAAYIGNAERLLTGDEAFDRAADEVGIYEVIDVDIEVTDVPTTDGPEPSASSTATEPSATSSAPDSPAVDDSTPADDDSDSLSIEESASPAADHAASASADESARAESQPEPVADPTESAIEPIDISGSDGSTTDAESTIDGSIDGITGEGSLTDPTESAGITDTTTEPSSESKSESESASETLSEAESASESASKPESASEALSEGESASESELDPALDDSDDESIDIADAAAESSTEDAAAESATEPTATQGEPDQEASSTLDPAEVEAAAAELDESEISWSGDEEETGEDAATDEQLADETDTDAADQQLEAQFDEEEQWRETRRIPSIDPEETSDADASSADSTDRNTTRSSGGAIYSTTSDSGSATRASGASSSATGSQQGQSASQQSDRTATSTTSRSGSAGSQSEQSVDRLKARLERLEEQREQLVETAEQLESERDQLRAEKQELSGQVQQLRSRIDELEDDLERARASDADEQAPAASTHLSPDDALSGTNLFVRYDSKSQPTLKTAHEGEADRDDVAANLRLEHHTEFDESDVAVAGEPYEGFLTETMAHRFVDWLTEVLLYEIRDTGHADGLGDLYDSIPQIDRAELHSTISLADDDTDDVPDQVTFDVVAYDKMGNPLALVTLNDSREPATEGMLAELEEAASAVKANYPELAAAIAVTSSYFDPGALEVTEQATSGSLLSRSSKSSYVNLSRKQGYHLCLVESRSEGFHMTVPEL